MIERPVYIDEVKRFIDKEPVKVITGIRRAGKSTVLHLLVDTLSLRGVLPEQLIFINFESFAFSNITDATELYGFVSEKVLPGKRMYLLIDEVQELAGWEKAINSFLVDFDIDIYLTGSNSHMLSSELSTFLAGRYVQIPVFTLSFLEFLDFQKVYAGVPTGDSSGLERYLRMGGFPIVHKSNLDEDTAYKMVRDIYASVILRDTIQRYKVREVELLERVIRYAFDTIGHTFSGKNVADYFKSQQRKVDINTIYNYLHALEGSYVLYRVPRYDIMGKEILKTQEKFYAGDVSLIYATMGYRDRMISGILENVVFLELKRRGYDVFVGKLYQKEIDFIGIRGAEKIYLQVAYKLESQETVDREFSPLLSIKDQYPKKVVTMDTFWKDNIEGVEHQTLEDFLTSKW
jgi:predicted AAA+ superfamily ATPase